MQSRPFSKGLHAIGNDVWAYLQPDGGWCLGNAGLIVADGRSLLVDTLFDLPLTQEMLAAMARVSPAARRINQVVNTHSHPDHTAGNEAVVGAEIIASSAARDEYAFYGGPNDFIANVLADWRNHGELGVYLQRVMLENFHWLRTAPQEPHRVFESQLQLQVGSKQVNLTKVGPAHTRGDVLVHVPQDRVVFTGDILFSQVHPILSPHVDEWLAACDLMLSLDVETVVPGHGPIGTLAQVREFQQYIRYFVAETRKRHAAGLSFDDAARDISLDAFRGWADEERIFLNTAILYRSFGAVVPPESEVWTAAARYRLSRDLNCASTFS